MRRITVLLFLGLLASSSADVSAAGRSLAQASAHASRTPTTARLTSIRKTHRPPATLTRPDWWVRSRVREWVTRRHMPIAAVPSPTHAVAAPARELLPIVDQKDIELRHRVLADDVLRSLPPHCRDHLKNFYVRYDSPSQRGLGGKSTIILSGSVPDDEFRALLIHECGHVADLGGIRGSAETGGSAFRDGADPVFADDPSLSFYEISWTDAKTRKKSVGDDGFVSGYATWDPFEDFAETYVYYVLQRDAFRARADANAALDAKFRWMERYAFAEPVHIATGNAAWTGQIPWDITKLGYAWHPETVLADATSLSR